MKTLFTALILVFALSTQAQTDTTKFKSATDYLHHREETDPNVTRIKKPALKIHLAATDTAVTKCKSIKDCGKACRKKKKK